MAAAATPTTLEWASEPGGRFAIELLDPAEWQRLLVEPAAERPAAVRDALLRLADFSRFEGKAGQCLPWSTADGARGLLCGRDASLATTAALRSAAAGALQQVAAGREVALLAPALPLAADPAATLTALAEGVLLSGYRFTRSGKSPSSAAPLAVRLVAPVDRALAEAALARARAHVAGIVLARDLVNAPAAELGPDDLADAAAAVARRHGFTVEVLRGAEVARRGFRMVAAVGRSSAKAPTVTIVRRGDAPPAVALIGKGVTFDSGGLSLKPADAMELMKKDMGGAAAVIGALESIGTLRLDLPLLAVIPSAENMVGPDAFRPGDILTAYDGTTVEIGNTDAEGRLLLADAFGYAREQKPARLIDYATLTGAARAALGPDLPALFCSDEPLAAALEAAARAADEPLWRLPLHAPYDRHLDSAIADVNHVGSEKRAGAITAALFLRRFAGGLPFAHVDLYAWEDRGRPETPKGGNGMGVRTLTRLAEQWARGG
ncbi:MAG: leucyl aminopeptidase family protein [Planctomycetes bacterium]|nr:leucyl aminopeptidase family protein [Planctomycetota bacterium]